jgi:hypothetical protein
LRAPSISSLPSGDPWLFSLPSLVGAPNPIRVRQAIKEGRPDTFAASIATAMAFGSCPSIRVAAQPADSNRLI